MAGRRPQRIATTSAVGVVQVDDPQVARAISDVGDAVQKLQQARSRVVITTDLAVGLNRVRHGLGRGAVGYTLVATVANATFAHAIDITNPRPDLEIWINTIGVAQPDARLEIW